jgi:uncharacterized protein (DUF305 family)
MQYQIRPVALYQRKRGKHKEDVMNLFSNKAQASVFVGLFVLLGSTSTEWAQRHSAQHKGDHGKISNMPFELHYIDHTIMHHENGIEMAKLAEEKSQNARVKAFARKTAEDQQKDIVELRSHRQHWYAGRAQMDHSQMMEPMKGEANGKGMKMDPRQDIEKLRAASGSNFDRLFLNTMIKHHKMAIMMSREAEQKAPHAEIKEFARQTVTKQNGEIAEMNRIKASLGDSSATKSSGVKRKPAA